MMRNPDSVASETYELKLATFDNDQLEEFLALLNYFKTAINGTETMSISVRINYVLKLLREKAL